MDAPPVFIGHYWLADALMGESPRPVAPNIACLDYSVAKGGPLTGYRWDGAGPLNAAQSRRRRLSAEEQTLALERSLQTIRHALELARKQHVHNDIFECFPGAADPPATPDYKVQRAIAESKIKTTLDNYPYLTRKDRRAWTREGIDSFKKWWKKRESDWSDGSFCREAQLYLSSVTCMLCLSKRWDNILTWSHYTNEHRRVIIEFDGNHSFFDHQLLKVEYSIIGHCSWRGGTNRTCFIPKAWIGRTRRNTEKTNISESK